MASTKAFKKTVLARAQRDPEYRRALLTEAINAFLSGDLEVSKIMLRDYINASLDFGTLARKLHKNDKSLQRMLGPHGNPTTRHFCSLLRAVQKMEGVTFEARIH